MAKEYPDIERLFNPKGIAVIGASQNENKIGYKILDNILSGEYKGNVYPVNPKGGEIKGMKVHKNLDEIDDADVAVISIPAKFVYDAVVNCGKNGVKFLVIITSGFSEIGNTEEENRIVKYANENGMRVLGPNIFGIYSASSGLNSTFGVKNVLKGHVSIITQSGALGIAMIGKTAIENIGLSSMISLGNKSDLDEADLVEYLVEDEQTRIIMMYIEGVQKGERLVKVLKTASKKKPIIVIKSGRSKRGAMAAASHTGSLAGSDEIFSKVMNQCGVIRAETLDEAFMWCKYLSNAPIPSGENSVIITNGGGVGVMATDACEKYKVNLLDDLELMKEIFSEATPDFGSLKNPVDITGQARSSDYDLAMDAGLNNDKIDAVMALYCETAVFDVENLEPMVEENYKRYMDKKKPITFAVLGGEKVEGAVKNLQQKGYPIFTETYKAVQCLGTLFKFYRNTKETSIPKVEYDMDGESARKILEEVKEDGRNFLLAHEAQDLMKVAGIHMPVSKVARSMEQAVNFAEEIGYPVVLKIVSKDIVHKSDAGGVALDLLDKGEVMDAYEAIMRSCKNYKPDAVIEGIEVCEMVLEGVETIIGARRDPGFGPIIMFGMGGIYVEVLKDVSFRSLPIDRREILRMIKETKAYPLLLGVRGEEKKDIDRVVESIGRLGTLIRTCNDITDIEINPLVVYDQGKGAVSVDARILINKDEGCD